VYVEVVVDQNGNVTRAIIKGNSDPNANLQQIARKAALEFKFDPASSPEQRGVITFNFRLKRAGQ
jgi:TonB family protein